MAQNLTHQEVWDDSALIDSWNEALEEYKKYHSIHRHGGNVDDLLKPEENDDISDVKQGSEPSQKTPDPNVIRADQISDRETVNQRQVNDSSTAQCSHPLDTVPSPVPSGLLASVRDEGLKRLLMSWYYAGYYTGYYEGQHNPLNGQDETP